LNFLSLLLAIYTLRVQYRHISANLTINEVRVQGGVALRGGVWEEEGPLPSLLMCVGVGLASLYLVASA
jgi:hypothetical protein